MHTKLNNLSNYLIFNDGKIYSKLKNKFLKETVSKDGYSVVHLTFDDDTKKVVQVHRLIAKAFIPNPNNLPQVNHKDENKQNNSIENLEWCTSKYNANFGTRNKRISLKTKNNSKQSKQVYQFSLDGKLITIWPSSKETGRCGYNASNVRSVCCGKRKSYKGFLWKN